MDEPSRVMTTQDESFRKAALLIASLEDSTSRSLLESIGGEAAARLREIPLDRDSLTDDQRSRVLCEFLRAGEIEAARSRDAEGVEIEVSLAAKLAAEDANSAIDEPRAGKGQPPWQPPVPTHTAAEQSWETQPTAVVAPSNTPSERRGAQLPGIADSVPDAPKPNRPRCSNENPRVSVTVEFDDLNALPDHALAMVFQRAEPRVALIALTGASPRLLERIRRQLPWHQGRELRRQIERLGPVRLSDVEHAQRKLAETTAQLIHNRIISPPKNRRFTTAA
jgi:hypothetical protein